MGTGKNIRLVRLIQHIKQDDLANMAGLSLRWLSKIENEQTEISKKHLTNIAKSLNMKVEELVNFHQKNFIEASDDSLTAMEVYSHNKAPVNIDSTIRVYQQLLEEKDKVINLLEAKIKLMSKKIVIAYSSLQLASLQFTFYL
jgi:transcriptional regulator with XRE-family HTH domain